ESSIGHIRDLPRRAADVPAAYKNEPWARLGVDVDNGFKPLYVLSSEKRQQVAKLRSLLKDASELYLATDEDREGESIAWHLLEVLSPPVRLPVKRMVFHEITAGAIRRAVDDWRDLDRRLVDAQEARRILDRLYGYEVSPVLWKKVMPKLSAGRVQSVATRMIVERERARMRFRSAAWWDLDGTFTTEAPDAGRFSAGLVSLDGKRLATGRDFDESGRLTTEDTVVLDEPGATAPADRLAVAPPHTARSAGPTFGRGGLRARGPPPLRQEGEERPGGPRGHPARGRPLPHPRRRGRRAGLGRAPSLRPGVEAHGGLADD